MACTEIIDDIEDLISSQDITPKERYASRKFVSVRAKKSATTSNREPEKDQNLDEDCTKKEIQTSVIPGTQKIYVRTWGCSHNSSDSEYMAGQLAAYGYKLTSEKDDADLWLLNSCTVKTPSEQIFLNEINNCLGKGKHLVLAGCVPQGKSKQDFLKDFSIIGVEQIDRVVEVVEETLKGHKVQLLKKRKRFINNNVEKKVPAVSLDLPKVRKNPLIEIIPINLGCLNQCTYCKTKHARGDLVSYGIEEICARAKQAFYEGCCEIWLTSEDLGTYGRDHDTSLVELVEELVKVVPGHCMIRLGMTNPPYILSLKTGMAELLNHPRIYSFLHIPVQSGSDAVLSDMKREYCREDFEELVDYFREKVPGITIATDIICGFPTETDKDFKETVTLCEKYKFPSLFINQFFPRAGTPAAKMPRVPGDVVKKRTASLTDVFYSYYPYDEKRVGKIYEVLVTEIAHDKKHYVAHNKCYEQILLPMLDDLLGKSVHVEIISSTKFSMTGKVLDPKEKWINCSNKKEMQTTNFKISNGKVLKFENTNGFISNDNPKVENNCYWLAATIGLLSLIAYGFVYRALKLFL